LSLGRLLVSVLSAISSVGGVAAAQPGGHGHFEKLDANADGVVTTAELQARVLERWTQSDANQDGKVTADEMKAQFAAHKQERFTKRDANGNGVLERAEVQKMPQEKFAKLDADQSGTLSQAELANGHMKHGGKGPRGEFKGLPGDADKDGAVTKAEATAGVAKMAARMDANGDGKLTQDELGRGHGCHRGARSDSR
jgi:Ca2+-binding EF-hand superfamily protein